MTPSESPTVSRFFIADSQGPRAQQQDAAVCLHDDHRGTALLVVGDGVGGRSGGRIASQKVREFAIEFWAQRDGEFSRPAEDLALLCREAHEHINREGARLGLSPRTTIVALYLNPTSAHWVHSGDSRLYHFRDGQLMGRTEDHTFLEWMVQRGTVSEAEMGTHPEQNTLLQCLGGEEYRDPSIGGTETTPEDSFLLCTDGFWERTTPDEMACLTMANRTDAASCLGEAVARAVERNGPKGDNVTVAVAMPLGRDRVAATPPRNG